MAFVVMPSSDLDRYLIKDYVTAARQADAMSKERWGKGRDPEVCILRTFRKTKLKQEIIVEDDE